MFNDKWSEWRAGWTLVLSAAIGVGFIVINYNTLGVFMKPLAAEFGWSRGQISAGVTINTTVAMLTAPFVGMLVDRYGARRFALLGITCYSVTLAGLALVGPSIWTWYVGWLLVALSYGIAGFVVWTQAVSSRFFRQRGLALALVLCGTGLVGSIAPRASQALIDAYGWRFAYVALGAACFCICFPLVWFFFRSARDLTNDKKLPAGASTPTSPAADAPGVLFRDAIRSARFWRLSISFLLLGASVSAFLIHLQPMLTDSGMAPAKAAVIVGILFPVMVVSRLGVGFLVDHIFAPYIAVVTFIAPAIASVILLSFHGSQAEAIMVAVLLGVVTGAELDLASYMTARYFGLRNFGAIFGVIHGLFSMGLGLSPLAAGMLFDQSGSYRLFFMAVPPLVLTAAFLMATLGRYPRFEAPEVGGDERAPAT